MRGVALGDADDFEILHHQALRGGAAPGEHNATQLRADRGGGASLSRRIAGRVSLPP
jgi:hypothetical protein